MTHHSLQAGILGPETLSKTFQDAFRICQDWVSGTYGLMHYAYFKTPRKTGSVRQRVWDMYMRTPFVILQPQGPLIVIKAVFKLETFLWSSLAQSNRRGVIE